MTPAYQRSPSNDYREIDRWDGGFGWVAHPDESGLRTSHAITADEGVWLFDPLDAPGIDERLTDLGSVAGVVVLADYHTRDATTFARR